MLDDILPPFNFWPMQHVDGLKPARINDITRHRYAENS